MSDPNNDPSNNHDTNDISATKTSSIEEVFEWIQKGNQAKEAGESYKAAQHFLRAQLGLVSLQDAAASDDDDKIRTLYQQQARDYLHRARRQLLQALSAEDDADQKAAITDDEMEASTLCYQDLSDEKARERLELFGSLFAKVPAELFTTQATVALDATTDDAAEASHELPPLASADSLESRLAALTASLPKSMQSTNQRMAAVNQGMSRLGVSVVSSSRPNLQDELPKSTEDQVAEIMAQARDEVMLAPSTGTATDVIPTDGKGTGSGSSKIRDLVATIVDDEDDSDSEQEEDIEDDLDSTNDDIDLTPETIRAMQEQVVEAQTQLAVLKAMLENGSADDDSEVTLDRGPGRKALKDARLALRQATRLWNHTAERA